MKKIYTLFSLQLLITSVFAGPGTYYSGLDSSLNCNSFLNALASKLNTGVTILNYGDVDGYYNRTDLKPAETGGGFVIVDRYSSDIPTGTDSCNFKYITDFCSSGGTASVQCVCFNKEHTFPSSFFDDSLPMRSDMHFVWPADSKVNGQKSNFPLGYVRPSSPTPFISYNGSKVGRPDITKNNGYWGVADTTDNNNNTNYNKVFEPADAFKGDFARAYLYVAARYHLRMGSWENLVLNGNGVISNTNFTHFEPWIIKILVEWHNADLPDGFEKRRNDSVFAIQGNRNPFIDYPHWVEKCFGTQGNFNACNATYVNKNEAITIDLFPNPTTSSIYFKSPTLETYYITVSDLTGKVLIEDRFTDNEYKLNLGLLFKGLYFISIKSDKGSTVRTIIKE